MLALLHTGLAVASESPEWLEAVEHDRIQNIALLLDRAENVDEPTRTGKTALMAAARRGERNLVARLLEAGADVEAVNKGGGSPLLYAAWFGDPQTVELLLSRGARIDHQSNNGWTALMMAASKNHSAAASVLLANGAAPNLGDIYGWTPLMRAAYAGHTQLIEALLGSSRIDVTRLNDQGQTALHLAVISGDARAVELLLEAGAPSDTLDVGKRTPTTIAQALGRPDLIDILRRGATGPTTAE